MTLDPSATQWRTVPLLGYRVVAATTVQYLDALLSAAAGRERPLTVGYLNAAQVNLAFDDPAHARALAALDWLYADGQAIVWGVRRGGGRLPERINAGDFTREIMQGLAASGLKLALVGGRPGERGAPGEVQRAADRFRAWAPGLNLVYLHHGYLGEGDAARVLGEIDAADPDLVLLGMGAPRQEARALAWSSAAGRPRVWWCVGALFEYYAGTRLRAPVWMRRAGLEWAVRLALEPGRLWRRYLIGNPLFVWRVLRGRPPAALDDQSAKGES